VPAFKPTFTLTPAAREAIADIDRDRWLIDELLPQGRHHIELTREIAVSRASSTTQIEGAGLDEAAVWRLDVRAARHTKDETENANALRAYALIDHLSEARSIAIDEAVIRQLNAEFIRGAAATLTPGQYRRGQNRVGDYVPPDQGDVPDLMRGLSDWLQDIDEHAVVKAAVAHLEFVAIHPFWDGNGRTARGLSTLILQRSEFAFRHLLSIEKQLLNAKERYFDAIEFSLGTRYSRGYDATRFVEFSAEMMRQEARRVTVQLTDLRRALTRTYDEFERAGLNRRQAEGLVFAMRSPVGFITREDYMRITGAPSATATRDLNELVRLRRMVAQGATRNRIFRPASTGDAV
jgi:Fic family protein